MNESILHFGGVRLRVDGSGTLTPTLFNLDSTQQNTPNMFNLDNIAGQEPFKLASLVTQRVKLRLETNTIGAHFNISRIVLYAKPIWESFPG